MAASYPTSVKTFATISNGDVIDASDPNDIQDEVSAIEAGLVSGFAHALLPLTSATYSIGSAAKKWLNGFFSGDIGAATATITGAATIGGTLTVTGGIVGVVADNHRVGGRLTLTTVTPVTPTDVTSASTIYFTPYKGSIIDLYDGSSAWVSYSFAELSYVLSALTNAQAYDLFAYNNAGVVALEAAEWANAVITMTIAAPGVVTWTTHGMATGDSITFSTTGALPTGITAGTQYWITVVDANTFKLSTTQALVAAGTFITTSGSQSGVHTGHQPQARQTALTLQNGVLVKTGATSRRFLGSFLTTSATTTEDSIAKRYLSNYYNRTKRELRRVDATASWNYTTNTYRQANAAAANQVDVFTCWTDIELQLSLYAGAFSSVGANDGSVGIGEDSLLTVSAASLGGAFLVDFTAASMVPVIAQLFKYPTSKRHTYSWLEKSNNGASGNTVTWVGTPATAAASPNGLIGGVWM